MEGGGGGGGGYKALLPIIAVASHHSSRANVKSYIGKVANRLNNQATIRPKMAKTPFSQR